MKLLLPLAVLLSFIAVSCNTSNTDEAFPFEIKLVVRGVLEPGKPAANIYIGRTLPIADRYQPGFANITNASAVIQFRGRLYTLRHTGNGLYRNDTLLVVAGEQYTLIARWEEFTAVAQTYVPRIGPINPPTVRSVLSGGKVVKYFESAVRPLTEDAYCGTWTVHGTTGNIIQEGTAFNKIYRGAVTGTVTTTEIPSGVPTSDMGIHLYVYDGAYYDYYTTQDTVQNTDAVFSQPKTNVKWNVGGDGIGLFLGRKDTVVRFR